MVLFVLVAAVLTLAGLVSIVDGLLGRRGLRLRLAVVRQDDSLADQAERWLSTQL